MRHPSNITLLMLGDDILITLGVGGEMNDAVQSILFECSQLQKYGVTTPKAIILDHY